MTTFVWRNGVVVEKHLAQPSGGSVRKAPNVISDIMDPTKHMATGRMHTSKSEFRKDTKASGCIEYGNDASLTRPRKPVVLDRRERREAIKKAIYELRR